MQPGLRSSSDSGQAAYPTADRAMPSPSPTPGPTRSSCASAGCRVRRMQRKWRCPSTKNSVSASAFRPAAGVTPASEISGLDRSLRATTAMAAAEVPDRGPLRPWLQPLVSLDVQREDRCSSDLYFYRIRHVELTRLHDRRQGVNVLSTGVTILPDDP